MSHAGCSPKGFGAVQLRVTNAVGQSIRSRVLPASRQSVRRRFASHSFGSRVHVVQLEDVSDRATEENDEATARPVLRAVCVA